MRKSIIAIKLSALNYAGLVDLGNRVITSMTGNANFATPAPTLLALQTAVTDTETAIAKWGPPGNRGNHVDLVDLRAKALMLLLLLKAEAQYVMTTAGIAAGTDFVELKSILITSGFSVAQDNNPQGTLQKVQNLHKAVSRVIDENQVKLFWKKPLNVTNVGNVKSYRVLRNNSTDITTAVEVGIVTRRSFVDTNSTPAEVTWTYWIVAYNAAGAGVASDPVTVKVHSA